MKYAYSLLLTLLIAPLLYAQDSNPEHKLIQLSGIVVSGDSLSAVPFTSVMIKGTSRGTICDYYGFFSLVARENDTLAFSSIGFKESEFVVPDTLTQNRYSMIQLIHQDTLELAEIQVFPWPSKEQFKDAFLSLNAPQDDYDRAFENLMKEEIRLAVQGVPMTARENSQYDIQREYTKLYQIGNINQTTLMNPLAWSQFIKAWKRGDFKSK